MKEKELSSGSGAGFKIRMAILLLILGAVAFALVYDWYFLKPRSEQAFQKVDAMLNEMKEVDDENIAKYVPDYLHEQLEMEPLASEEVNQMLVETYSWSRMTPMEVGGTNGVTFMPKYQMQVAYKKSPLAENQWILFSAAQNANAFDVKMDAPVVKPAEVEGPLQMPSVGGGGGGGGGEPQAPKPVDIDLMMKNDKNDDGTITEKEIEGRDSRIHGWFEAADKDSNKEVTKAELEELAAEVEKEIAEFEQEQKEKEDEGSGDDDATDSEDGDSEDGDSDKGADDKGSDDKGESDDQ